MSTKDLQLVWLSYSYGELPVYMAQQYIILPGFNILMHRHDGYPALYG